MAFLPDTNVWISLLKNPGGKLDPKVQAQPVSEIFLCALVKAELWHGAEKYGNRERRRRALDTLFAPFASLPFDDAVPPGTTPRSGTRWKFRAGSLGPTTSRSRPSRGRTGSRS